MLIYVFCISRTLFQKGYLIAYIDVNPIHMQAAWAVTGRY